MTGTDFRAFASAMHVCFEAYDHPASQEKIVLYFTDLEDLEVQTVVAAFHRHRQASKFFPKISEIREAVVVAERDGITAAEAWSEVLGLIRQFCGKWKQATYSSPRVELACRSLGGLESIWMAGIEKQSILASQFIKAYDSISAREIKMAQAGLITRDEATHITTRIFKALADMKGKEE